MEFKTHLKVSPRRKGSVIIGCNSTTRKLHVQTLLKKFYGAKNDTMPRFKGNSFQQVLYKRNLKKQ